MNKSDSKFKSETLFKLMLLSGRYTTNTIRGQNNIYYAKKLTFTTDIEILYFNLKVLFIIKVGNFEKV